MSKFNLFELMTTFWKVSEVCAFTSTEAALYFFLLHKANQQMWRMPITCSTETIRAYLSTTKQSISKARKKLRLRGLIDFTSGTGNGNYASYTLKPPNNELSVLLSLPLSDELSDELPIELPVELSLNKDIRYNTKDNSSKDQNERDFSLEDLADRMLGDDDWQQSALDILTSMGSKGIDKHVLREYINQFFLYLHGAGYTKREDADCRKHFINWLCKKVKRNNSNSNEHKNNDSQCQSSHGENTKQSSYYDPF